MTRSLLTLVLAAILTAPVATAAQDGALPEDVDLAGPALEKARAAAQSTGAAIAAAGKGAASVAAALGGAIADAAAALGAALAAGAAALGRALAALGALLGALLASGARAVAAHPKESAIVAGSAGGLATLYALVKRFWLTAFLPLYSRLAPSQMLDNEQRARVYAHVKANPGAHPSAMASALGLGWGTIVYHLARLEESKLVTTRSAHARKCYFVVGADLDGAGRTAVAAMATDKARAIVDALRAEPGLSQKDLAARLGMSQALASWHVKRLVASGVLNTERAGRSNLLRVAEHVPVVVRAAPALAA